MLYYRGDKFVKSKKFSIYNETYKFLKRSKDNKLVFESLKDKSILQITESEFEKSSNKPKIKKTSEIKEK